MADQSGAKSFFKLMAYKDEYEVARSTPTGLRAAPETGIQGDFPPGSTRPRSGPGAMARPADQGAVWLVDVAGFKLLARLSFCAEPHSTSSADRGAA
jgi:hypothetical protein